MRFQNRLFMISWAKVGKEVFMWARKRKLTPSQARYEVILVTVC